LKFNNNKKIPSKHRKYLQKIASVRIIFMNGLKNKKILVIGMAGSGKTFVSQFLSKQGVKAFDGDKAKGLSGWFDQTGKKVLPKDLSLKSLRGLEWNWDRTILKKLLEKHQKEGVLLFGISSNWYKLLDLFDKVFLLYVGSEETKKRLASEDRENEYAKGETEIENVIKHIEGFRKFALEHGAIPLGAKKSPQDIYTEILNKANS
jgi:adenylate kinase family enzyme